MGIIERGEQNLTLHTVLRVCRALDIDLCPLVGGGPGDDVINADTTFGGPGADSIRALTTAYTVDGESDTKIQAPTCIIDIDADLDTRAADCDRIAAN